MAAALLVRRGDAARLDDECLIDLMASYDLDKMRIVGPDRLD